MFWALVLIGHSAFHFVLFFKPNSNELIIMITMINITIIETYPLKKLILRKPELLEMTIDNKHKFAHEL